MKKNILIVFLVFTAGVSAFSQCDDCQASSDKKADYCYQSADFEEYCVLFNIDQNSFSLVKGKRTRVLPLADADSLKYFISLVNNKSYKLSGLEVLLLQQAIKTWNKEKKDIGMEFTESGLGYKIITQGTGARPEDGQTVSVNYIGSLESGKQFDNSYDRGQPIEFPIGEGRVIKGWDEGIKLLNVGTKALLKIPPQLGYGERGAGGVIPPNATLYFEVELVGIK